MKKAVVIACGVVFGLGIMAGAAQAADKFAYVDLSKIFSEYTKTKDYDKVLTEKEDTYTADREKKVSEVKSFQDKLNVLSAKEKETKKTELENKVKALREFDNQKQTELRKEQDTKMKEILKDIEEVVKNYAQKEGYTMVFNDRVLVYQDKGMDITEPIIDLLNKGLKK